MSYYQSFVKTTLRLRTCSMDKFDNIIETIEFFIQLK